jgi:hypothetical protein
LQHSRDQHSELVAHLQERPLLLFKRNIRFKHEISYVACNLRTRTAEDGVRQYHHSDESVALPGQCRAGHS